MHVVRQKFRKSLGLRFKVELVKLFPRECVAQYHRNGFAKPTCYGTHQRELPGAEIGVELKTQYVLGYRPTNRLADGKWRKIKIKINKTKGMPSLSVRAKAGYYSFPTAKEMK
jgi:hypothetical protein